MLTCIVGRKILLNKGSARPGSRVYFPKIYSKKFVQQDIMCLRQKHRTLEIKPAANTCLRATCALQSDIAAQLMHSQCSTCTTWKTRQSLHAVVSLRQSVHQQHNRHNHHQPRASRPTDSSTTSTIMQHHCTIMHESSILQQHDAAPHPHRQQIVFFVVRSLCSALLMYFPLSLALSVTLSVSCVSLSQLNCRSLVNFFGPAVPVPSQCQCWLHPAEMHHLNPWDLRFI